MGAVWWDPLSLWGGMQGRSGSEQGNGTSEKQKSRDRECHHLRADAHMAGVGSGRERMTMTLRRSHPGCAETQRWLLTFVGFLNSACHLVTADCENPPSSKNAGML